MFSRSFCEVRMSEKQKPVAVAASEVPARSKPSAYPEPFASRMLGRTKRQLGDVFGLTNFGVNLTGLPPIQFQPFDTLTPSKMSSSISSKVGLRCTPTKDEPSSRLECVPASRQAQVTDTA